MRFGISDPQVRRGSSVVVGSVLLMAVSAALLGAGPGAGLPLPGMNAADVEIGAVAGAAPAPAPPATATRAPTIPERNAVPDGGRARDHVTRDEAVTPWDLPAGSLVMNPASGRAEVIDPAVAGQAVLFGDSQAGGAKGVEPAGTWVAMGLTARGYQVRFLGAGGTGFVARTALSPNYLDAVVSGNVVLPYGNPALVVVQGGGNDAGQGATDAQILANADRLLRELKASYPSSQFLFIGTLSGGSAASGDRRGQIDAVLAGFAKRNGIRFVSAGGWISRHGVGHKMADGVHLTAGGHRDLAKVLAEQLKALGLRGPGLK